METPQDVLEFLIKAYSDERREESEPLTMLVSGMRQALGEIGSGELKSLLRARDPLNEIQEASHVLMKSPATSRDGGTNLAERQVYTDACIACCLIDLTLEEILGQEKAEEWLNCIRLLDSAIVFSGAPERFDIVQALVRLIQSKSRPTDEEDPAIPAFSALPWQSDQVSPIQSLLPLCGCEVQTIEEPDMISFLTKWSHGPFVIRGGVAHWPALNGHPWASSSYLLHAAGKGRTVPVEVGRDYRLDNWSQEMMDWETFLTKVESAEEPLVYLAQHSLLDQFPALRDDIVVPDLAYFSPTPKSGYARYLPPGNEDGLIINAWLGPKGTCSPAHQDPYFNCYAQVVGSKTVWLAPPDFQAEMYPLPSGQGLSNTSSLDVFSKVDKNKFPLFTTDVLKTSVATTLHAGDLLFFPPGWWHAMRSESKSFSVSFWF